LTNDFLFVVLEGKTKLFLVFFGRIYQLLLVSRAEQWADALAYTLFLQVAFLNIYIFSLKSLIKDRYVEWIALGRAQAN
jgi:hypothetical protein